jgi:hypothetical protein
VSADLYEKAGTKVVVRMQPARAPPVSASDDLAKKYFPSILSWNDVSVLLLLLPWIENIADVKAQSH